NDTPVFTLCVWNELTQFLYALFMRKHDLLNQVFCQRHFLCTCSQHGDDIIWLNGLDQVHIGACFQELRRKAGKRAKQQGFFVINKSCIQMRHRHWRSTYFGFSVHLRMMLLDDFRIIADKEQSTYRESANML